jgi:hypothetical protein
MSSKHPTTVADEFEECMDELDEFVESLDRYPHEVLVFALRAHLAACLLSLQDQAVYTPAQTREFLRGLIRDVLSHPAA